MDRYRIIEVKQSVFADNDAAAERLRGELDAQGTYLINLMSSPGSGKTTTLLRLLPLLQRQLRVGVMEADIDSDVDADTVSRTGAKVIQLHTGGMCHLDAGMTREGLQQLDAARYRRASEPDDPLRPGGARQAAQIPAHLPDLRRDDRQ